MQSMILLLLVKLLLKYINYVKISSFLYYRILTNALNLNREICIIYKNILNLFNENVIKVF